MDEPKITWIKPSPYHNEWYAKINGKQHQSRVWRIHNNGSEFRMFFKDARPPSDNEGEDDEFDWDDDYSWNGVEEFTVNDITFRYPRFSNLKSAKTVFSQIIPLHLKEIQEAIDSPKLIIEDEEEDD